MPAVRQKFHLAPCADFRDRLYSAFSAAMDDRHLVEILNKQGITKFTSTKAEFERFIPEEIARYKSIIDRSGARIE